MKTLYLNIHGHVQIFCCVLGLSLSCESQVPAFRETFEGVSFIEMNAKDRDKPQSSINSMSTEFQATTVDQASVKLNWSDDMIEQTIDLEWLKTKETVTHQQINRPLSTEAFEQGTTEFTSSTQSFSQSAMGILDILIVIDNSGSMSQEQQTLGEGLVPLLEEVEGTNWRIAVVTTSREEGCLRSVITNYGGPVEDYRDDFMTAVTAGVEGHWVEEGVYQARAALESCGANWLRPDSSLAVLIVSDEDNCSNGEGCTDEGSEASWLIDYLNEIRSIKQTAKVYGIFWQPEFEICEGGYYPAAVYQNLVDLTGGVAGSICPETAEVLPDYTDTLSAISRDMKIILQDQFALDYPPVVDSLKVFINNEEKDGGYLVNQHVITFTDAPPSGASIRFEYDFISKEPDRIFNLSKRPDPSTMSVRMDGNNLGSNLYQIDGNRIVFNAPPDGRELLITYAEEGLLSSEFVIGPYVDQNSVSILVNGTELSPSEWSSIAKSGNGTSIVFNDAPADAAKIDITFDRRTGPRYEYPVFANIDQSVDVYFADDGNKVNYERTGHSITIHEDQFTENRKIVVKVPRDQDLYYFDTGFDIIDVSRAIANDRDCQNDWTFSGKVIDLSGCGFELSETVDLDFDFVTEHKTSFSLRDWSHLDAENVSLIVEVNGKVTDSYQIDDGFLKFDDLPYMALIKVTASSKVYDK